MLIEAVNEQHDADLHLQMIEQLADYAIWGNFCWTLRDGFLKKKFLLKVFQNYNNIPVI